MTALDAQTLAALGGALGPGVPGAAALPALEGLAAGLPGGLGGLPGSNAAVLAELNAQALLAGLQPGNLQPMVPPIAPLQVRMRAPAPTRTPRDWANLLADC